MPLMDQARIYACGITPYDVTHLGHAATFVWVDTLTRVLRTLGVEPVLCRNVTDVDDVLVRAAKREGLRYDDFAAFGEFRFEGEMAALNVRAPDYEPRAHRYVRPVIRLAAALVESGAAYVRDGSVYFRGGPAVEAAGTGRDEALRLAAQFGDRPGDPAKDAPLDAAVWQAGEPGYPAWDSPWGPGRPGWHAECAAMALSVFGPAVDIHAGGADLKFPHHTLHAAMAEALTGVRPCARAWLHVGTVTIGGAKMAKSAGNLVLAEDLLAVQPAAVIRLMILARPWASSWDYTPALLTEAANRLEALHRASGLPHTRPSAVAEIRRLLGTDLDVPAALDVATDAGGDAARLLTSTLGLT
ncbi:MAG TPA: cysteine--tRNA ligase [Amycolatopsis sp.]|nr:cysteine--tRNA ligase [Amycolatopsis sp.]HKS46917.1 cysteine--tRNA ligase [Amycolatopsis sp.]